MRLLNKVLQILTKNNGEVLSGPSQGPSHSSENREWQPFSEMRKTNIGHSGGNDYYSEEYAQANGLLEEVKACYYPVPSVWVPEPIEVMLDREGNIFYRQANISPDYDYKKKRVFKTSQGKFIAYDRGEWGGTLHTPTNDSIEGTFKYVFDFDGAVYGVGSSMTGFETVIYKFSTKADPELIYETDPYNEALRLNAIARNNDAVYILISGFIGNISDRNFQSRLLVISGDGIKETATFKFSFASVTNMVVKDNNLIIGMDKTICIADISNGDIQFYTSISIDAENDILATRRAKEEKQC